MLYHEVLLLTHDAALMHLYTARHKHTPDAASEQCLERLTNGLCGISCPMMDLIHLDDYMVALDQDISTEQAISSEMIQAVFDAHITEHLCHLGLVLRGAAGLYICHESLHNNFQVGA